MRSHSTRKIAEWGYDWFAIPAHDVNNCGQFGRLSCDATTRTAAFECVHRYWSCRSAQVSRSHPSVQPLSTMLGHYLMHHYAAEWGALSLIGSEVGENIDSIQAHFAFNRGAARQFHSPWFIDFSDWNAGRYHGYKMNATTHKYDRGHDGHSISLRERVAYLTYMAGANKHLVEDPSVFLDNNETTSEGFLPLSPVGQSLQRTHAFFAAHPDRGVPYVPVALMVDVMHGMGLGWWNIRFRNGSRSEFDAVPGQPVGPFGMSPTLGYTEQDNYTTLFLNTIWPEAMPMNVGGNAHDESKRLVPSKYAEIWDILVADSVSTLGYGQPRYDAGLLGAGCPECGGYRALFLLGNIDFHLTRSALPTSLGEIPLDTALWRYVHAGGVLVLTAPVLFVPGNNFSQSRWKGVPTPFGNAEPPRVNVTVLGTQGVDGEWVRRGCGGTATCTIETYDPASFPHTNDTVLSLVATDGSRLPAVTRTRIGTGHVLTLWPPKASALDRLGALDWVLDTVAGAVTPFAVTGGEVQVLLNRRRSGWNITLVNNLGVTKTCSVREGCTPDMVDPSKASGRHACMCTRGRDTRAK